MGSRSQLSGPGLGGFGPPLKRAERVAMASAMLRLPSSLASAASKQSMNVVSYRYPRECLDMAGSHRAESPRKLRVQG